MTMTKEETNACVAEMKQRKRLIEIAWIMLIRSRAPDGASAGEVRMVRYAFFQGAQAVLDVMRMAAEAPKGTGLKVILELERELKVEADQNRAEREEVRRAAK
jgi:hypothetical protein